MEKYYLGHNLVKRKEYLKNYNYDTYKCINCEINIIIANGKLYFTFLENPGPTGWHDFSNLSCDEVIIKGIIE